jgi:hypothetical protein
MTSSYFSRLQKSYFLLPFILADFEKSTHAMQSCLTVFLEDCLDHADISELRTSILLLLLLLFSLRKEKKTFIAKICRCLRERKPQTQSTGNGRKTLDISKIKLTFKEQLAFEPIK